MSGLDESSSRAARVADGSLWRELSQAIAQMETVVYNDPLVDSDLVRAEGLRYLTRILAGGIQLTQEAWDPHYPQLQRFLSPSLQYGLPAADCRYHWAAVTGGETYRIFGTRGSCRILDVETREGHMSDLNQWRLCDRSSTFDIGSGGEIDIVLSQNPQPGNWIRLPGGPGSVIVREYFYDWLTEEPAFLDIERVGAHLPPPPVVATEIAHKLELLQHWLRNLPEGFQKIARGYYQAPLDSLDFAPIDVGFTDLQYGKGHYRCGRDEAVILELTLPETPYWNVQLADHYWQSLDWHLRQTSINGHQAVVDPDGIFRAVISRADPGVPNWLDPAGHDAGLIAARFFKATSQPLSSLRTVPLAELRGELPATTPIVSSEERQRTLSDRARSVRRRMCD